MEEFDLNDNTTKKTRRSLRKFAMMYPLLLCLALLFTSLNVYAAPKDRTAPTAPTGLKAVQVTETSVSLAWTASTDNVKVQSYTVYQGTTAKTTTSTTSATLTGLSPGTSYTYYVKARDAAGNISASSNSLTVTTVAPAPVPAPTEPAPAPTAPAGKQVIGYYASWATYSGKQIADLDASKLTHIQYAFANIGDDLRIAVGDSYADVEKVFPNDLATDPFHGNFNQLLKLKKANPHLKTLISVGGWSWSAKFSDVALTDASRTAFADSAVAFILKYGFDGVDIDWEYPVAGGAAGNVKRPEDKTNFTLLMQKLREKLDAQSALDGKKYLLSFAGAAGSYYTNNVELAKLQQYVDYVGIMSYDIHGTWETKTGFNAPLYKDPNSGISWETSVHDSVQLYLSQGVPAAKLVMGVPFYGYRYDNVTNSNNGLYQTFSGGASLTYSQIVSGYLGQAGYTRYFNTISKVPYLFNGSSFISYDDPESIGYKASYVKSQGLAGAMVWELTQDTGTKALLQALHQGLQ
jgi:chitinase